MSLKCITKGRRDTFFSALTGPNAKQTIGGRAFSHDLKCVWRGSVKIQSIKRITGYQNILQTSKVQGVCLAALHMAGF